MTKFKTSFSQFPTFRGFTLYPSSCVNTIYCVPTSARLARKSGLSFSLPYLSAFLSDFRVEFVDFLTTYEMEHPACGNGSLFATPIGDLGYTFPYVFDLPTSTVLTCLFGSGFRKYTPLQLVSECNNVELVLNRFIAVAELKF